MKLDRIVELVRKEMDRYPAVLVRKTLREMKIRYVRDTAIYLVRVCLAFYSLGIPITTLTLQLVTNKREHILRYMLHCLGDKYVLVYKRTGSKRYEWTIHPVFLETLERVRRRECETDTVEA